MNSFPQSPPLREEGARSPRGWWALAVPLAPVRHLREGVRQRAPDLPALGSGEHFPSTQAAFSASASQRGILPVLERCRYVVLGWRGAWQLSGESPQWFRERFVRRFPAEGQGGPDVWERRDAGARAGP